MLRKISVLSAFAPRGYLVHPNSLETLIPQLFSLSYLLLPWDAGNMNECAIKSGQLPFASIKKKEGFLGGKDISPFEVIRPKSFADSKCSG